jgi:hypothetical protein
MEPGTLLYDPATDKVGEYQDRSGPYALLRPVGGGREWQADPAALRPATDRERIGAGVRAANSRTRELLPPRPVPGCARGAGRTAGGRTGGVRPQRGDRRERAVAPAPAAGARMSRRRIIQEANPRYAVPPPLLPYPPPLQEPEPAPPRARSEDVVGAVLLTAVSVGSLLVAAGLHLLL